MLAFLIMPLAKAQDTTVALPYQISYRDSLVTTHDTVDVVFGHDNYHQKYTITAWTDSGTDTLKIYTETNDAYKWVQEGLVDLSSNASVASAALTSAAKEFEILDVQPLAIRITTTSYDGSKTRFIISGKDWLRFLK
jgi:hypothetical protein